jgi:hypothetical protein
VTVLKMSVCFYICAMAVTMVASPLSVIVEATCCRRMTSFLDADILHAVVGAVLVVLEIVLTVPSSSQPRELRRDQLYDHGKSAV